ncbi:MAG: hypothetical protein AAFN30_00735 [Actinomycetota bacterium]
MHPVSTALFIVGYALSLPIAFRMGAVAAGQHRAAFAGHQIGVVVALVGWIITGRVVMAVVHGLWLLGARLWFVWAGNRSETAVG